MKLPVAVAARTAIFAILSCLAICVAAGTCARAHADTYVTYEVSAVGAPFLFLGDYGITDSGVAVYYGNCVVGNATCYYSFVNGVQTAVSLTPPNLVFDNGAPCTTTILPPGFVVSGNPVCNSGYEVVLAFEFPEDIYPIFAAGLQGPPVTIYDGFNGYPDFFEGFLLNNVGDFLYYPNSEVVDLTTLPTPEPASLWLLATGLLGAGIALRRRFAV